MIEDEMLNVKVAYIMVDMVLPPVEGEEQGQVLERGVGMCQNANDTIIGYDMGFQEHAIEVTGLLRQPAPPVQHLKG